MGAHLSAAVPSIALPVERYVADLSDMEFQCNLGSTRFMKVARVVHSEGQCVVKVFVINDPSLPLPAYMSAIEKMYERLKDAPNCLPFAKVVQSSKAAFLIRQYVAYNLYDRLSTRPFLADVEKRWIAFQLLKALEQCQEADVCHGDIKTENVLITSSAWTLLADFANFKPSTIPYDNPADFTYFFDSSRRRTCYIAPERFTDGIDAAGLDLMPEMAMEHRSKNFLKHEMDIFSLGCVLLELFCDSSVPFDLSQLLAYRQNVYYPKKVLESLSCPRLAEMIASMISRNAEERPSARECLEKYRDVFPSVFYDFLWDYMKSYVDLPLLSDDEKIDRIHRSMDQVAARLRCEDGSVHPCILIPLCLVTSLSRSVAVCNSKLRVLELLKSFAPLVEADVVLDRILPFVLHFVNDPMARIRAIGIQSVTQLMASVKRVPASDTHVFMDYIFPCVLLKTTDDSSVVKLSLASCIGRLAVTAKSFLEEADVTLESDPHIIANQEVNSQLEHKKEISALEDLIQDVTVTLLSDSDLHVRKVLVQDSLELLCNFFGNRKASDVLLSHIVTFLNEKNDWRLRHVFFHCCPMLFACAGEQSWSVLLPLYQQGLRDCEENVIFATFSSLQELFKRGLLGTTVAFELIHDVLPFLRHPNLLLRIGAVSFVCNTARILRQSEVHCKLIPKLETYIESPFFTVDREECLLHVLKEPVPRPLWDVLLGCPQLLDLLNWFRERRLLLSYSGGNDQSCRDKEVIKLMPKEPKLRQLYEKLRRQGLNDEHESVFISFASNLLRLLPVNIRTRSTSSSTDEDWASPVCLDLSDMLDRVHYADMSVVVNRHRLPGHGSYAEEGQALVKNIEWMQMFGSDESQGSKEAGQILNLASNGKNSMVPEVVASVQESMGASSIGGESSSLTTSNCSNVSGYSTAKSTELLPMEFDRADFGPQDVAEVDTTCAAEVRALLSPCQAELRDFIDWQRDLWAQNASRMLYSDADARKRPPNSWKPTGTLLADLHEHSGCVSRLAVHSNGRYFVSAGWDGCIKVWDVRSLIGRSMSNRSTYSFKEFGDKANCVDIAENCVVCSSCDGSIKFLTMVSSNTRSATKLPSDSYSLKDDYLIDFKASYKGSHLLVIGLSHHGQLCCLDSRCAEPAWSNSNPDEKGLVTCLCVDQERCSWALVGTETGYFVLWDLRFRLNVREFKHPANIPILRLCPVDGAPSRVLAAFVKPGEVSEWDLESGIRHYALWPSSSPPLSYQDGQPSSSSRLSSVSALYQYAGDMFNPGAVVTGDYSGCIRYWNLANVSHCSVVSSFNPVSKNVVYKYKVIDGAHVVSSSDLRPGAAEGSAVGKGSEIKVTTAHHDLITDLKLCHVDDWTLVSSSRDGVIKLWR